MPDRSEPNFYQLMLGLPADIAEPDHYQLLGLERFAEGNEAIRAAAADQNGKLLTWQNSKYYKEAGRLMLELAQARGVLLDPEQKLAYDEELGRAFGDEEPVILLEAAPDEEPIVLEAAREEPQPEPRRPQRSRKSSVSRQRPGRAKQSSKLPARWSLIAGSVLGLIGLGALGWSAWNTADPDSDADPQTASHEEADPSSVLDMPAETSAPAKPIPAKNASTDGNASPLAVIPFDEPTAEAHQAAWAKHENVPVEVTNSIGMKLRLIPAGEFLMGTPPNEPGHRPEEEQHLVRITRPYYLSRYEVTTDQYFQIVDNTVPVSPKYRTIFDQNRDHPKGAVTFYDALDFCNRLSEKEGLPPYYTLENISTVREIIFGVPQIRSAKFKINGGPGYRLPTEAEWEFACRAGTTTATHYGDSLSATMASFSGQHPYNGGTPGPISYRAKAVGSYNPNAFGLYDMHGNAQEWCIDAFIDNININNGLVVEDPMTQPSAQNSNRYLVRGGDATGAGEQCRSGRRWGVRPDTLSGPFGFRVARGFSEMLPKAPKVADIVEPAETPTTEDRFLSEASGSPPLAKSPFDAEQADQHQAAWAKHLNVPVEVTNKAGMKLRLIPPGEFLMGSPPTEYQREGRETLHRVRITEPYLLGAREVSYEEYHAVIGKAMPKPAEAQQPMQKVTWYDCIHFCNQLSEKEGLPPYYELSDITQRNSGVILKASVTVNGGAGYRLPTEAEWEFACRPGTETATYFGDDPIRTPNPKDFHPDSHKPLAVGSFAPNAFGVYDMHGNVLEWCFDYLDFDFYRDSPLENPVQNDASASVKQMRVVRGSSHIRRSHECRSAWRGGRPALNPSYVGFRVARTPRRR